MALKRRAYTRPSEACAVGGDEASLSSRVPSRCARARTPVRSGHEALTSRRVAAVSAEGLAARPSGAAVGADLGGSSKYSSEALED